MSMDDAFLCTFSPITFYFAALLLLLPLLMFMGHFLRKCFSRIEWRFQGNPLINTSRTRTKTGFAGKIFQRFKIFENPLGPKSSDYSKIVKLKRKVDGNLDFYA